MLLLDSRCPGPSRRMVNGLGLVFMTLRTISYASLSLTTELPERFTPIFSSSYSVHMGSVTYIAGCLLMMMLLHRLLPHWACTSVGVLHGAMYAWISYRYNSMQSASSWSLLYTTTVVQAGMFGPYHLLVHLQKQAGLNSGPQQSPAAFTPACNELGGSASKPASALHGTTCAPTSPQDCLATRQHTNSCAVANSSPTWHTAAEVTRRFTNRPALAWFSAKTDQRTTGVMDTSFSTAHDALQAATTATALSRLLDAAPYKPRQRITHKVCVKLDTELPCSSLPANMAEQLQAALCAGMGFATILRIIDMAVRPGCICITMKIGEELRQSHIDQGDARSQLHLDELAQVLLPKLQGMLSDGQDSAAVQRSTVQVGCSTVACNWNADQQAWELQTEHAQGPTSSVPGVSAWLGVVVPISLQPAVRDQQQDQLTRLRLMGLMVKVQLWGVSKVSDVEGWTPPEQHQDNELQWPGAQQSSGSSPALKLLARAAGGYLPTQLVRLVPGSTDGSVTAQVLVQLHEHQLVRHHEGCSPSTLLLMDLELWQNEVLLSSSPLLSLPTTGAASHGELLLHAWWWGAADSTVAKALAELRQFAQQCMVSAASEVVHAVSHTYIGYTQDLAVWLAQVQRTAHASNICCCSTVQAATQPAEAALLQPCQPPARLMQLGRELVQYARHIGWNQVQRLVQEQMRNVVEPALHARQQQQRQWQWQHCVSSSLRHSIRVVLLGYPCHHDEQLYKQRLAVHLASVLVVSSTAAVLMGVVWFARAVAYVDTLFLLIANPSFLLHTAALVQALCARGSSSQGLGNTCLRRTLCCITLAYVWRNAAHMAVALWIRPNPDTECLPIFRYPHVWPVVLLVMVVLEQVPASVVLPAPAVTCMALLIQFPAVLSSLIRSCQWHPAVSAIAALGSVVGTHIMVDLGLRTHLSVASGDVACCPGMLQKASQAR